MARKAVRLSDIAEKLGVSTVTVSNALANQRGVSEELREKIKEMASEMGYHAPGTQIMANGSKYWRACAGTLSGKWIIVLLETLSGTCHCLCSTQLSFGILRVEAR